MVLGGFRSFLLLVTTRHSRVVYFALFFQTGCNEQVTQSSVGTKHGYNPKSVDSKCKKLKQR